MPGRLHCYPGLSQDMVTWARDSGEIVEMSPTVEVRPAGMLGLAARARRGALVGRIGDIRSEVGDKEGVGAAESMEQGFAGVSVNLSAQAIHVKFNQIKEGMEGLIPQVFGEIRAHDNTAGVGGK